MVKRGNICYKFSYFPTMFSRGILFRVIKTRVGKGLNVLNIDHDRKYPQFLFNVDYVTEISSQKRQY